MENSCNSVLLYLPPLAKADKNNILANNHRRIKPDTCNVEYGFSLKNDCRDGVSVVGILLYSNLFYEEKVSKCVATWWVLLSLCIDALYGKAPLHSENRKSFPITSWPFDIFRHIVVLNLVVFLSMFLIPC